MMQQCSLFGAPEQDSCPAPVVAEVVSSDVGVNPFGVPAHHQGKKWYMTGDAERYLVSTMYLFEMCGGGTGFRYWVPVLGTEYVDGECCGESPVDVLLRDLGLWHEVVTGVERGSGKVGGIAGGCYSECRAMLRGKYVGPDGGEEFSMDEIERFKAEFFRKKGVA